MTEEWNTGEIDPNGDGAVVKLSGPGSDGYAWTTDTYFLLAKSVKYYPESQNFRLDPEGNVHRGCNLLLKSYQINFKIMKNPRLVEQNDNTFSNHKL